MRSTHGRGLLAHRVAGPARGRAGGLLLGRRALARLHAVGRVAAGRGARGRRRPPAVRPRPQRRRPDAGGQRACSPARSGSWTSSTPRCARRPGTRSRSGRYGSARSRRRPRGSCRGAGVAAAGAEGHAARRDHARADPCAAGGHARPGDPRQHAAVPAAGRRVARAGAHDAVRARAGRRRRRRAIRSRVPGAIEVEQLEGQVWVASRSDAGDSLLGVWPGLAERPDVRYVVRDWLAKLQIVAAGLAITTLAPIARRRPARRGRGRRRARRAAGDAAPGAGAPARTARRLRRPSRRRGARRRARVTAVTGRRSSGLAPVLIR